MKEAIKPVMHLTLLLLLIAGVVLIVGCGSTTSSDDGDGVEETSFVLSVSPAAVTVPGVGETAFFDVNVVNADALIGARFTMSFNPSLFEVTKITTSGGDFLFTSAGATVSVIESTYDNDSGRIVIGIGGIKKGFTGASGDGRLASVTIRSKQTGSGNVSFLNSDSEDIIMASYSASNTNGWIEVDVKTVNGSVTVQ